MVTEGPLDAITGDWLSELNIAWNAIRKYDDPTKGYEVGFLEQLEDCINIIAEKKIKVVSNAGALNTPECARKVRELCEKHGQSHLKVAYIAGDDISDIVSNEQRLQELGGIVHLDHQKRKLEDWKEKPYCGVAYFGAWGIVEALHNGADIVVCGRVTDASPVIALAAWWHNWTFDAWNELAGALIAGRKLLASAWFTGLYLLTYDIDLVECGPYVTGANFSGLRSHLEGLVDLGFPIAEIADDGTAIITKHPGAAGYVEELNVRAQFLYEIQGTKYINPDVLADIEGVRIENTGEKDRVRISGAVGGPPPPTTKAISVAIGGYQAEATFYMNGLDIDLKEKFMRQQLEHAFRNSNFTELSIERYGSAAVNPSNQASGTVSVRVLVKGKKKEDIAESVFRQHVYALRMQFYAGKLQSNLIHIFKIPLLTIGKGYHMSLDFRTMTPKMFMELFPGIISYTNLPHQVVFPDKTIEIKHHGITQPALGKRPSTETANPVPLESFGPTKPSPLGAVAHGRSGDKGDNCNVGLFARNQEEFAWLQNFLTVPRMKELLGEDYHESITVERCEFPYVMAVHYRLLDFLGGGAASSTRIDMLGKGVAEYIRSKVVDIPVRFLDNPISIA
jgi:Acyclic terpene utilisation family protein AtuA